MVGSIIIKNNPVTLHESYLLSLSDSGRGDGSFSDYAPDDRAEGGYWSCSFAINGRENLLREMFENGLGRHVEVWGYGLQQDFEGYIHEMTYHLPPDRFTMSLENVANKIWMRTDYDADGDVERTTTLTEADSIGRFGTKEAVLSGGETEGLSVADQSVQTYLNLRAWPKPEAQLGQAQRETKLEIFCRGYIHTLGWRIYNQTIDSGSQGMSAQIEDIIDDVGEFVASYSYDTNSTLVSKEYDADRRSMDIILDLPKLGDANNIRWNAYMLGRNATDVVGRKLYLKQSAPSVFVS